MTKHEGAGTVKTRRILAASLYLRLAMWYRNFSLMAFPIPHYSSYEISYSFYEFSCKGTHERDERDKPEIIRYEEIRLENREYDERNERNKPDTAASSPYFPNRGHEKRGQEHVALEETR